jgi:hypothetical protein
VLINIKIFIGKLLVNIDNWELFYKRSPDPGFSDIKCETNILYTPYQSPDKKVLCMHWDAYSSYQKHTTRPKFNEELLDYFFKKEVDNILKFQTYSWCPKVYDVDYVSRKVFIEWVGETCNDIVYSSTRNIDEECPTWRSQLLTVVNSIIDNGFYKMSLYPHCFFIKEGEMHTIDWYACFDKHNFLVDYSILEGMIGENSKHRFIEAVEGQNVNFEKFFKLGVKHYIEWPAPNPLQQLFT